MMAALEVRGLKTHFFTRNGVVKAVDGVDLRIEPGRVLGLVGESGSGKSVTGLSILGLIDPPGRIVEHGPTEDVLANPRHHYTRGLLDSVPGEGTPGEKLAQIPGSIPALIDLPPGCAFKARCGRADVACETMPEIADLGAGRGARCVHPLEAA